MHAEQPSESPPLSLRQLMRPIMLFHCRGTKHGKPMRSGQETRHSCESLSRSLERATEEHEQCFTHCSAHPLPPVAFFCTSTAVMSSHDASRLLFHSSTRRTARSTKLRPHLESLGRKCQRFKHPSLQLHVADLVDGCGTFQWRRAFATWRRAAKREVAVNVSLAFYRPNGCEQR